MLIGTSTGMFITARCFVYTWPNLRQFDIISSGPISRRVQGVTVQRFCHAWVRLCIWYTLEKNVLKHKYLHPSDTTSLVSFKAVQ
jgi:hypothetical protein